jgi:hypothetical protein
LTTLKDQLRDLGVDRNSILNQILKKQDERAWVGFIWLKIWTKRGFYFCEIFNELSVSRLCCAGCEDDRWMKWKGFGRKQS